MISKDRIWKKEVMNPLHRKTSLKARNLQILTRQIQNNPTFREKALTKANPLLSMLYTAK